MCIRDRYDMLAGDRTTFVLFPEFSSKMLYLFGFLSFFLSILMLPGVNYLLAALALSAVIGYKAGPARFVDAAVVTAMTLSSVHVICEY